MPFTISHTAAVLALLTLSACNDSPPPGASNDPVAEWHLAPAPRLSIGVADGDDRYMFRRITGVVRTPSGGVIVSDVEPSLSLFDSAGTFVKAIGRKGSGPGEYEYLFSTPYLYRGDSVAVWDFGMRRVSVFHAENGTFGRSQSITMPQRFWPPGSIPSQSCCRVAHAFPDGSFVLEFPAIIPNTPGPNRNSALTLARVSADGARSDTIGTFGDRRYRYDATAPSRIRELRLSMPFFYTVIGDTVIGGNGEGQWLVRVVPGGALDTIRLRGAQTRVTDSIKAAYAQSYRDEYVRRPQFFEGNLEENFNGEYMEFVPAYTRVLADRGGRLWLQQWAPPFNHERQLFHIHSTRGALVARITLPADTWILHLGAEQVTLVESDSNGVQYVRAYDIIRGPR